MRPQHITAENLHRARDGVHGPQRASMRPQHITAENMGGAYMTRTVRMLQ